MKWGNSMKGVAAGRNEEVRGLSPEALPRRDLDEGAAKRLRRRGCTDVGGNQASVIRKPCKEVEVSDAAEGDLRPEKGTPGVDSQSGQGWFHWIAERESLVGVG